MHWHLPDSLAEDAAVRAVASELALHPLVARVLVQRGHATPAQANAFLGGTLNDLPDPSLFEGMSAAVDRLARAVRSKERVVAYGDYDVDGVASTALLLTFLRDLGADVEAYIPNRLTEGYGLNAAAVDRLASQGTRLLVTLDCGVTQVTEVDRAVALGMDVVVVDHHQVSPQLPRATAILNPQQPGCRFPQRHLCAAGVTFFLLAALRRRLREEGFFTGRPEPRLREMLDLVALATIADVVPLTSVNRLLVREGLVELGKAARPGIRALRNAAGLPLSGPLTCGQVGFRLTPRLNAAGRLDDARRALSLLLAQTDAEATPLADGLDKANRERQQVEARILDEALRSILPGGPGGSGEDIASLPPALVLASEQWHVGVVGIVASRLVERTGRPTLVLAIEGDEAKGSGRSIPGFQLHAALARQAPLLSRFGGHAAAAGLALPLRNLDGLRVGLCDEVREQVGLEGLGPRCRIDARVDLAQVDAVLARDLERLRPFGSGNPEPVFAVSGVRGQGRALPSRTRPGETHLKLRVQGDNGVVEGIGFGMGGSLELLGGSFDAAFHVELDAWQGNERLQLRLKAIRAAA